MKLRSTLALCAIILAGLFALAPLGVAQAAKGGNPFKNIAVTGSTPGGGSFKGNFDIKEFKVKGDQIVAVGMLKGQTTNGSGPKEKVNREIEWPVQSINGTPIVGALAMGSGVRTMQASGCEILDLQLGPLDLTLLGLNIFLDEVNLEITAIPGGGLLGDLLCAVNGLLGSLGNLLALVDALNDLLAFFR